LNLALYQSAYGNKGNQYREVRQLTLGLPVFKPEGYPQLRDFFQKAAAQDQQQVVLDRVSAAAAAAATGH
jgi:hypothetical protein